MSFIDNISSVFKASSRGRDRLIGALLPSWNMGRPLPKEMDYSALLKAYRSWIYVCGNRNAVATASTPLRLYVAKPMGTKGAKTYHATVPLSKARMKWLSEDPVVQGLPSVRKAEEIEEVVEHPWLEMMDNVNAFMNQFSLWEVSELYQELCGNCYWYVVEDNLKVPREIWPAPPDRTQVIPDPKLFIKGYLYTYAMEKVMFDEREIVHFKMPNPRSSYYGMGPLAAVVNAYNLNEEMDIYEQAVFRNMGRVEGFYHPGEQINNEEFQRVKTELENLTRGAKNAGKTPFFPIGVKHEKISEGPRELSFLKGEKKVKEQICNAYGQSVAMYDEKAVRANAEMAEFSWQKNSIRPRLLRIEQKINEKMMPRYDENLFVAFDNNVPEDKELRIKENTEYVKSNIKPVNEVRSEMGWEDLEGFDEPWVQAGTMPASVAATGGGEIAPEDLEDLAEIVAKAIGDRMKHRRYFS